MSLFHHSPAALPQHKPLRALLLTVVVVVTLAGNAAAEPRQQLAELIVSASRSPQPLQEAAQTVTILERADLERLPGGSLFDALEQVSGVDLRQRGPFGQQADVAIRGGSFEQTLILINGIPQVNPQTGHHNLDLPLQLADIERIEIVKGPSARLYGANAMAGAINIVTRASKGPAWRADLSAGDHDALNAQGQARWQLGTWHHRLGAGHQYSSGHRHDEPTGFNSKVINYQAQGELAGQEMQALLALSERDYGASRYYFDDPQQKERSRNARALLAAELYGERLHWRPTLSLNRHEDRYRYAYNGRWFSNDSTSHNLTPGLQGSLESALGQSSFGYSGDWQQIRSSSLGDHQRHLHNLFFNQRYALGDRLQLGSGLHALYSRRWGWQSWPGAEISLAINRQWHWFAAVGGSFRIPTYTEMYYQTPNHRGDADLKPEEATTWETGLRWQDQHRQAHLSLFRRDSDNLIDWAQAPGETLWQVRNVAHSRNWGVESGLTWQQPWPLLPWLVQLELNYSWLHSDFSSNGLETKYSRDQLRHQLHTGLQLQWLPPLSQRLQLRYERRFGGEDALLVDSRLRWQFDRHWSCHLDVTDLFDQKGHESGFVERPGRWLLVGISWQS
ncbi:MAG: TonB-dependent receptor [Desulfuromonas thiophila]|nr:TonB-dependent receptor [Desulfuromonas thiophila]